jgi:hypothetical protein
MGEKTKLLSANLTAKNGESKSANDSREQLVSQEQGDHSVPCTWAKGNRDSKGERDPYTNARRRSRAQADEGDGQRPILKERRNCFYTSAWTKGNRGSHPW